MRARDCPNRPGRRALRPDVIVPDEFANDARRSRRDPLVQRLIAGLTQGPQQNQNIVFRVIRNQDPQGFARFG